MHDFAETLWFQPEVDITHQSIDKSTTDMLNCMCDSVTIFIDKKMHNSPSAIPRRY